ncbi:hypothetical protein G3I60_05465 [Streptomyces sp. SID13666]|uniref:hypothetical protein n=1 Tax=Streptomyces sp. SID13666 TaxID=2706054 RepID=UPI0013C1C354|nr:hypothetical protein [Streptomyces sp. SID13666]NEA53619.1 hypothetical protein [Streptomyces sp. SID13666]
MSATDRALMLLPFEEWISLDDVAAQHISVDAQAATLLVREGRRRGVLRTRGKGPTQEVIRIYPNPRRHPASPQT